MGPKSPCGMPDESCNGPALCQMSNESSEVSVIEFLRRKGLLVTAFAPWVGHRAGTLPPRCEGGNGKTKIMDLSGGLIILQDFFEIKGELQCMGK